MTFKDKMLLMNAMTSCGAIDAKYFSLINQLTSFSVYGGKGTTYLSNDMRHFEMIGNNKISYPTKDGTRVSKVFKMVQYLIKHEGLRLEYDQGQIEVVCGLMVENCDESLFQLELVSGVDDIHAAYRDGPPSCMKGKKWVKLYGLTPENIQLLVIRSNKSKAVLTRALVWTTDCGLTLIDRPYGLNSIAKLMIMTWAKENGAYLVSDHWSQVPDSNLLYDVDDECITINTGMGKYGFPYMDTFYYTNDNPYCDEIITISGYSGDYSLDNVYGEINGLNRTSCEWCNEGCSDDDLCYVESANASVCPDCLCEHFTICENCHEYFENDEVYHIADVGEYWCEGCASDNASVCDKCCDTVESSQFMEDVNETWCDSCFDKYGVECHNCNEAASYENCTQVFDLQIRLYVPYCSDCSRNTEECCICGNTVNEDDLDDRGACPDCEDCDIYTPRPSKPTEGQLPLFVVEEVKSE